MAEQYRKPYPHLACALRAKCDVFLAWDNKLTTIQLPDIRTEEPRILGQLMLDIESGGEPPSQQ